MNYWVRTLERMESALPKLLHKGGWKGIVRGGTHRAHRIDAIERTVAFFVRAIGARRH